MANSQASTVSPRHASKFGRFLFGTVAILAAPIGLIGLLALLLAWGVEIPGSYVDTPHQVHQIGWGALYAIIYAGGALLAQVRRPERKPAAMQQLALTVAAILLGAVLAGDWFVDPWVWLPVVALVVLIALHPDRARLLERGAGPSGRLGALALVGAVPLVVFALLQAAQTRAAVPGDIHLAPEDHWLSMARMALATAFLAGLAAFRTRGFRIPAWSSGLVAIVYGAASVAFPGLASSAGVPVGVTAITWGAAFIVLAEAEARRLRREDGRPRAKMQAPTSPRDAAVHHESPTPVAPSA